MDILSKEERSQRMSAVRSTGNRSTEWKLRAALVRHGISGWKMHARWLPGVPDFVFPKLHVAIFIDGCFWHGCPQCRRPLPRANRAYWTAKLKSNVAKARSVSKSLRKDGFRVIRIWEHEIRKSRSIDEFLLRLFHEHKH